MRVWATTLGVAAVALGCAQYAPQLVLTARRKLVGSLSIPMMCLQVRLFLCWEEGGRQLMRENRCQDRSCSCIRSPCDQASTGPATRPYVPCIYPLLTHTDALCSTWLLAFFKAAFSSCALSGTRDKGGTGSTIGGTRLLERAKWRKPWLWTRGRRWCDDCGR